MNGGPGLFQFGHGIPSHHQHRHRPTSFRHSITSGLQTSIPAGGARPLPNQPVSGREMSANHEFLQPVTIRCSSVRPPNKTTDERAPAGFGQAIFLDSLDSCKSTPQACGMIQNSSLTYGSEARNATPPCCSYVLSNVSTNSHHHMGNHQRVSRFHLHLGV